MKTRRSSKARSGLQTALEGAFTKIARAQSKVWGVNIVPSGTKVATDGNTIYMPWNSDDLKDIPFDVLNGYLDHEVGHVCAEREHKEAGRPTPMDRLRETTNPTVRAILNILEDIRIERQRGRVFPGVESNLRAANLRSVENWRKRVAEGRANENFWYTLGSVIVLQARGCDASWLPESFNPYMDLLAPEIEESNSTEWFSDVEALAYRMYNKVQEYAKQLKEEQERQEQEEQEQDDNEDEEGEQEGQEDDGGEQDDEAGDDSDELGEDGDSGPDADGDDAADGDATDDAREQGGEGGAGDERGDEEGAEGDGVEGDDASGADAGEEGTESDNVDGDADGEQSDEAGEEGEQGDADPAPPGDDLSDGDDDDAVGQPGGTEGDDSDDASPSDASDDDDGSDAQPGHDDDSDSDTVSGNRAGDGADADPVDPETDQPMDLDSAGIEHADEALEDLVPGEDEDMIRAEVGEEISKASDVQARNGSYIPDPGAVAKDEWITPDEGDAAVYARLKAQVQQQVSALRAKLVRIVKARAQSRNEYDQDEGRLDVDALHQLRLGSKRIFSKTVEGETLDTAVEILVDLSGSMGYSRSESSSSYWARLTVIALGEALDAINVPFEIIGFHNTHGSGWSLTDGPYVHRLPFQFFIYKSFNESHKAVRRRLVGITGMKENVDGEAVLAVAKRLAARPESRKLMFVFSDGSPCCPGLHEHSLSVNGSLHLLQVIEQVRAAGIVVFGLGLAHHGVKHFYGEKFSINIDKLETMAENIFKVVRSALLAGYNGGVR